MSRRRTREAGGVYIGEILRRQVNIERADILLQISTSFSSGNGNDVVPLGQHPGEGKLCGRAALFCSKPLDPIHQFHIPTEILLLETGHAAAPIVVGKIIKAGDLGGQEPAAKRTICDEADAKLAHRIE